MKMLNWPKRALQGALAVLAATWLVFGTAAAAEAAPTTRSNSTGDDQGSSDLPTWYRADEAAAILEGQAAFEAMVINAALDGVGNSDFAGTIPARVSPEMRRTMTGLRLDSIAADLARSGLEYTDASVDIRIDEAASYPPTALSPPHIATSGQVYVTYERTTSVAIDLTGATDVQGFDPAEGLSTGASDQFVAAFARADDGGLILVSATWLAPHSKALADRPLGWSGAVSVPNPWSSDLGPRAGTSNDLRGFGIPDSVRETSSRTESTGLTGDEFVGFLNDQQRQRVVDYAQTYALDENEDYKVFENDCTNFISQALHAGGWETISRAGLRTSVQDDPDIWFYRHMTFIYPESAEWATWTWTGVDEWFNFARNESERTVSRGNIWRYLPGEVLQINIDASGDIDHSTVVTGKWVDRNGRTQMVLSYHTNNRLNRSIRELLDIWDGAWWYGHRT